MPHVSTYPAYASLCSLHPLILLNKVTHLANWFCPAASDPFRSTMKARELYALMSIFANTVRTSLSVRQEHFRMMTMSSLPYPFSEIRKNELFV